jgi:pimeloyl-ACP methyl ester carboxylesterase
MRGIIPQSAFSWIVTMMNVRIVVLAVVGVACSAAAAPAQSLSELLPDLLRSTVVLAPPPPASGFPSHEAHFLPTATDNIYQVPTQFNGALVNSLNTFPIGSSSGGFVFEGDPSVGDFRPASRSYGPSFAERALTAGRGTFSFGLNFQTANFSKFDGKNLDDGSIKFYLRHIDTPGSNPGPTPDPFFEGDLIETSVSMDVETSTTALLFNYGLTDRWDVGAAVPIQHVSVNASVLARVDRAATGSIPIHVFPGSNANESLNSSSGSATGIGDLVLRTKYRMWKIEGGGLAAGVDLRVPTGKEEDLLGLGTTQAKFTLIGSKETSNGIAPHFNLSYTYSGEGNLPEVEIAKELGYIVGIEGAAGRVSFAADLIGRTLFDAGRFEDTTRTFPLFGGGSFQRTEFGRIDGNLTQLIGAAGVKVLVANRFLVTGNVLFSLNDAGLTDRFVPVIGIEYALTAR